MLYGKMTLVAEKEPFFQERIARQKAAEAFTDEVWLAVMANLPERPEGDETVAVNIGRFTAQFTENGTRETPQVILTDREAELADVIIHPAGTMYAATDYLLNPHELKTYEATLINHSEHPFFIVDPQLKVGLMALLAYASYVTMNEYGSYRERTARVFDENYYDETTDNNRSIQVYDYDFGESGEGNVTNYTRFVKYWDHEDKAEIVALKTKTGNVLAAVQTYPMGEWGSVLPFDGENPRHASLLAGATEQLRLILVAS